MDTFNAKAGQKLKLKLKMKPLLAQVHQFILYRERSYVFRFVFILSKNLCRCRTMNQSSLLFALENTDIDPLITDGSLVVNV